MFQPIHTEVKKILEEEGEEIYFLLLQDYCKKLNLKLNSVELNYTTKKQILIIDTPTGTRITRTLRDFFRKELNFVHRSN